MKRLPLILPYDWIDVALFNLGEKGLEDYEDKVRKSLDRLEAGKHYDLLTAPISRREIVLAVCMSYINIHPNYELSEDKTIIYNRN